MTAVGRPKEFDREVALEKAMELFWAHGYESTGLKDLLEHMGIGRQSLYDTFGDKRGLFLQAIEHYNRRITENLECQLNGAGTPLDRIRRAVTSLGKSVTDGRCRGCLLTNTLVESAPHDDAIADASRDMLRGMERGFYRVLKEAVDEGQLPKDAKIRALARYLTSTIQGLVVMGKSSVSRSAVKDIIDVALSVFD